MSIEILPVLGLPDVRPGQDLAQLIAGTGTALHDGDVIVVTQKVVSKAEGRLVPVPTDEAGREAARHQAVLKEAVRIVAGRGTTLITETSHGFVLAASGVDASNVRRNEIALLPIDPDRSARVIRSRLRDLLGVGVAVVISDTFGRPWRNGLTDVAIGAAGISALRDYRGEIDEHGNTLAMTEIAVVDEVAAAAELVMGKLDAVPVAVVRGLAYQEDDRGIRPLVRAPEQDLFRLGTDEAQRSAVFERRSVRTFVPEGVDPATVERAIAAALTAPAPHHSEPWRFVLVDDPARRDRLLDTMSDEWVADLRADGFDDLAVERRLRRGDVLRRAPCLIVPCFLPTGMKVYPDDRRRRAEREMFLLSMGAGIENLLVALAAERLGSCWVGSTLFCQDAVRRVLDLPSALEPMGAIAVGRAAETPRDRPLRDVERFVLRR